MEATDAGLAKQPGDAQFAVIDPEAQFSPAERELMLDLQHPDIAAFDEDPVEIPDGAKPRLDTVIEKQALQNDASAEFIPVIVDQIAPEAQFTGGGRPGRLMTPAPGLGRRPDNSVIRLARDRRSPVIDRPSFTGSEDTCLPVQIEQPRPEAPFQFRQVATQSSLPASHP